MMCVVAEVIISLFDELLSNIKIHFIIKGGLSIISRTFHPHTASPVALYIRVIYNRDALSKRKITKGLPD